MEPTELPGKSMIHFVIVTNPRPNDAVADNVELEGIRPNEKKGGIMPLKQTTGTGQEFACCMGKNGGPEGLSMTTHAGKNFEGASHSGTDDSQFVTCPLCHDTQAFKKAKAEHDSHTGGRGVFSRLPAKRA